MTEVGWFLVLFVAICVIALILLKIIENRRDGGGTSGSGISGGGTSGGGTSGGGTSGGGTSGGGTSGSGTSGGGGSGSTRRISPPSNPPIYAYKSATLMVRCPTCDGENSPYATHCEICGHPMR